MNGNIRRRELAVSAKLENREQHAAASIALQKQNAANEIARGLKEVQMRAEAAAKLHESTEAQSRQVAEQRVVQEQWYQRQRAAWESERQSEAAHETRVEGFLRRERQESEALNTKAGHVQRQLAVACQEAESARWDMHEAWTAQEEAWSTEQQSSWLEHRAQQDLLATARINQPGPQSWPADAWGYGPWGPPWGPSVRPPHPWEFHPRRRRGGQMEREGRTGHLKLQRKGHGKGYESNEAGGPSGTSGGE